MAKLKVEKETEDFNVETQVTESTQASDDIKVTAPESKAPKRVKTKIEKIEDESLIPDNVKNVLKCFSNLDEVYVNGKGGVFTKDTDKELVGKAVLYKNPYFKH